MLTDTKALRTTGGFDINPDVSSGLIVHIAGGVYLHPSAGYRNAPNVRLTLTASALNYVEMSDAGVISANTTGFTVGATFLYAITTNATIVTDINDCRGRAPLTQTLTVSGAILPQTEIVYLNATTPLIAATIAAPAPGRRLLITQIDSGTAGHTVTLTAGTWNGTNTIATFNALGETLEVIGLTAIRFGIVVNIGAVGLS
jgi:hypothetical protein